MKTGRLNRLSSGFYLSEYNWSRKAILAAEFNQIAGRQIASSVDVVDVVWFSFIKN